MSNTLKRLMRTASVILGIIIIFILIKMFLVVNSSDYVIDVPMDVTDSKGTDTTINDSTRYSFRNMKKSDWFEVHFVLDESELYNQVLVFPNELMLVNIYVDDELIYSNGDNYTEAVYRGGIEMVPLSTYKSSKDVRIRFSAPYYRYNATLPVIQLKDNTMVYTDYIQQNFLRIGGCIILIVLGLILVVYGLVSGNFDNQSLRIIIVAAISVLCGAWIMADCKIGIIFAGNYSNLYYIRNISIFLCGIAFFIYLDIAEEYRKVTKGFIKSSIAVLTVYSIVAVVLHALGISYMNKIGRGYVVLLATFMVIYGVLCLFYDKKDDTSSKVLYIGIILAGLLSVVTMIKNSFLSTKYSYTDYIISIIVMAVIIFFNTMHIGILITTFLEKNEKTALEDLAYRDTLTNVYNRNMCEKKMGEIDSRGEGKFGIIIFDVKGLKKVNDTYGHNSGDELLKVFAGMLKDSFKEGNSFLGRFGGDEFMVIVEGQIINNVDRMLEELEKKISKINEEHEYEYMIAYRYGKAICDRKKNESVWSMLTVADKRMYGK